MKNYVLGFLFNEFNEMVVLIRKNKPDWQKGLLNGVGGKIEEGETPEVAMIREFKEETGVTVTEWRKFALMKGSDWMVYCFVANGDQSDVETMEEEEVVTVPVELGIPDNVIPNLYWLLPLALDADGTYAEITYP